MVHFRPYPRAIAFPSLVRVNRPVPSPLPADSAQPLAHRLRVAALLVAYAGLVLLAWASGNGVLSAVCVVILITAVLASPLRANARWAWLVWIGLVGGVVLLGVGGHGRIALDLVPLAINLGLALLFGLSLSGAHTPMIARAIIAIEGAERLAQPRVARYARVLTLAWTMIFAIQVVLFAVLVFGFLPTLAIDSPARRWALSYLHLGGYLLPAIFMLVEYVFRRWYLRHLPHVPPQEFLQKLVRNWPQLLRDSELHTARKN